MLYLGVKPMGQLHSNQYAILFTGWHVTMTLNKVNPSSPNTMEFEKNKKC